MVLSVLRLIFNDKKENPLYSFLTITLQPGLWAPFCFPTPCVPEVSHLPTERAGLVTYQASPSPDGLMPCSLACKRVRLNLLVSLSL